MNAILFICLHVHDMRNDIPNASGMLHINLCKFLRIRKFRAILVAIVRDYFDAVFTSH